jgi:heat shock 70kDa protein 4
MHSLLPQHKLILISKPNCQFAVGALSTNPRNTISQIKRLMGKRFSDPAVQEDLANFPFKVSEAPDGRCLVDVEYLEKPAQFTPEQIMAALLVDLKEIAEKEQGGPVTDAVISVPVFYTEPERHAMLAAAQVAGLNCLRLLDDTTATALAWGIYKTDLAENDAHNVCFVDVGYAATQVCVVALKKGELQVLANAWDRSLGGRDFDAVLFEHFAAEFAEKYKVDVRANPRSSYRLMRACERTKRVLTTNPEAPINVESLTPDVDANGMITREVFEDKAKSILDRLLVPVQKALQDAGLSSEAISNVEVIGGSTRVPAVLSLLTEFFGREPSRTLNAKETVARGCALQCAMLSPAFKVREFQVRDAFPYGVQFSWDKEGETVVSVVFERGSHVPSAKMLTFYRTEPFELAAEYTPDSDLPSTDERFVGRWKIGPFSPPAAGGKTKLKVKVVLNLNGVVAVDSVNAVEEEEVEEQAAGPQPAAAAEADAAMPDAQPVEPPAENGSSAPEATAAPATEAAAVESAKKKVRTKKIPVPFEASTGELSKEVIQQLYEAEVEMALQTRMQEETADARNAVETYVYSLRNRLYDALGPFVLPEKRDALLKTLEQAEDWLYDEGEDQPKSVYVAKLQELKQQGAPVENRATEAESRPAAVAGLRDLCKSYLDAAKGGDARFVHLSEEELGKVASESEAALSWLHEKEAAQAAQAMHDDPVLLVEDIKKKSEMLARVVEPILSKPAPKPEPVPKKPEQEASVEKEEPAAERMDTDVDEGGAAPDAMPGSENEAQ